MHKRSSDTLGREARAFVDFLKQSGFSWWQVLPFSLPDMGNSPYLSYHYPVNTVAYTGIHATIRHWAGSGSRRRSLSGYHGRG